MGQYINKMIHADLIAQKKSSVFQFFGTILGLIPGIPWVGAAGLAGASTAGGNIITSKKSDYSYRRDSKTTVTRNRQLRRFLIFDCTRY